MDARPSFPGLAQRPLALFGLPSFAELSTTVIKLAWPAATRDRPRSIAMAFSGHPQYCSPEFPIPISHEYSERRFAQADGDGLGAQPQRARVTWPSPVFRDRLGPDATGCRSRVGANQAITTATTGATSGFHTQRISGRLDESRVLEREGHATAGAAHMLWQIGFMHLSTLGGSGLEAGPRLNVEGTLVFNL